MEYNSSEKKPDLTLFYTLPANDINNMPGSNKNISVIGTLYDLFSDFELIKIIGSVQYNRIDSVHEKNKIAFNSSQAAFILPEGSIIFNSSNINKLTSEGHFKENQTLFFPIVSGGGSGSFTFSKGWVVINTFKDGKRIVYIYFD
jgi:hypothetical protein